MSEPSSGSMQSAIIRHIDREVVEGRFVLGDHFRACWDKLCFPYLSPPLLPLFPSPFLPPPLLQTLPYSAALSLFMSSTSSLSRVQTQEQMMSCLLCSLTDSSLLQHGAEQWCLQCIPLQ